MMKKNGWTLVTGGAKRLGKGIALALAKKGLDIVIQYNQSAREALHVVKECRSFGVKCECIQGDFSERKSTEKFVQEYLSAYPNTRNLINNVGNYLIKNFQETTTSEWYDLIETNLNAPFIITKALVPSIIQTQGSILNLGVSGIRALRADTHATAYTITKEALWGLTLSLAKELEPYKVRVNMVSPGFMDISVDLPKDTSKLPMQRPATTDEVLRAVSFLLDDENSYITAQNIEVTGGLKL